MTGAASSPLAGLIEKRYRGGLGKFAAEDLLLLERELRKLQEPHGRVFWRLERLIGRIDDGLVRRTT
jgi:hypothetical protein